MSFPRMRVTVGIALLAALGFTTMLLTGWGGESVIRRVDDLGLLGFAVFGAACSGVAAQHARGRHRTAWICMSAGLGCWAVGEAIWCYYEVWHDRPTPFPSLADAAFLLFPVGAGVALLLFPLGHTASSRTRLVLDGLIVAGAMFVVSWVNVLADVYHAGGTGAFALTVSIAYPIADIVIITAAVLAWSRARAAQQVTVALTTAGIVLMALADSAFVYLTAHQTYYSGHLIDLGWMAGLLVLGGAALASTREPHHDLDPSTLSPTWLRQWLPYLPLVVAGAVAIAQVLPTLGPGPVPAVAFGLVIAVLLRQFVVVTEDRRILATLTDQALRDPLTGLANRLLFLDRLDHAVALQRRERRQVAVVSVDLDDFKAINDHHGHPAGDALLVRVAERLLGSVRATDTVARLGGDEFAVLIEDGSGQPGYIAHRVAEAFDAPFVLGGHSRHIRPSVGLAVLAPDDTDTTAGRLLEQADIAMYAAKRTRSARVHTYTPGMALLTPCDGGDRDPADGARASTRSGTPVDGRAAAPELPALDELRHTIEQD